MVLNKNLKKKTHKINKQILWFNVLPVEIFKKKKMLYSNLENEPLYCFFEESKKENAPINYSNET